MEGIGGAYEVHPQVHKDPALYLALCLPYDPRMFSSLTHQQEASMVQVLPRPINKHVTRWPALRATLEGYVMVQYSDGRAYFFMEGSSDYAMLTHANKPVYDALKSAIQAFPQP